MTDAVVPEWTLDGVLDEMKRIHNTMADRQFAFILGAGASFTSGIPTGQKLAKRWLEDLHLRECTNGSSIDNWLSQCGVGDENLTIENAAEFYPEIFERRFDGDREAGYAELEAAMEGKSPSLGYSLLAEIIQHTRHKVVVTTNFDNLVADALAMHAHQSPLVVAHESLASFVRPQLRRPLVAKIHRDLYLNPLNDIAGVSKMELGWKTALKKLFQYFTPVVVGYGGNDGSLMGMLMELDPGDIAGRMIWCYREGSLPPEKARNVLLKHRGVLVKVAGFDEFMLQLAAKLVTDFDVAAIADRTAKLGQLRADRYREQANKLSESSKHGSPAEQRAGEVLTKSVRSGQSWWAWELKAKNQNTPAQRNRVYLDGLKKFPNSVELHVLYANFLASEHRDDEAEQFYKKGLAIDPNQINLLGSYANFLADRRLNYDAAEEVYKKALEVDPTRAITVGNYANFLETQRKDIDGAEIMYKKSIELDSTNAINLTNYASYLADCRQAYDAAETMYKKALEQEPNNVMYVREYANFLADHRGDYETAHSMYKKAIELDPNDADTYAAYADFLSDLLEDYDAADPIYKKTIELDPRNSRNLCAYALFLDTQREDSAAAEAIYKKVMEADPNYPWNLHNYANLLAKRNDFEAAETLFERAIKLDPNNKNISESYSAFLKEKTDQINESGTGVELTEH